MAIRLRVTLDVDWIGDGTGFALVGQNQSNNPGYGAALGPGPAGVAQTLELMVSESVPGGDTPTLVNLTTALNQAATDLATLLNTPDAWAGNPGTPLSYIDAWATGGL